MSSTTQRGDLSEIYQVGYEDCLNGIGIGECPFEYDDRMRDAWLAGWRAAAECR